MYRHTKFTRLLLALIFLWTAANHAFAAVAGLPDFTTIVENHGAAVVNISTSLKTKPRGLPGGFSLPDSSDSDLLNDFLRKFLEQHPDLQKPPGAQPEAEEGERFESNSLGSGFIISADGYVVTNHHVIADASEIVVRMSNRKEYTAEVIGSDPRSDVAVLKIEATDLPVLTLGSAEKLKVGEWVLAIGSPFNFDHSVTAGIVSAKERSLPSEQYTPFLQTDVAINPGNSGGPLFNLDGEVVGINSQIYSRTGGFMGVSFAIPIEVAMDVVAQLKKDGKVTRGWLGVYIQEITSDLAESFGLKRPRGALVAQVLSDSPAEKAGVEVGDILLSFNAQSLSRSTDLPPLVGRVSIGEKAVLKLLRENKELDLDVVIEALPDEDQLASSRRSASENKQTRLGLVVNPLTEEIREQAGVSRGVIVDKVSEGPAKKAGIRSGDIIVSLNSQSVNDVAGLDDIVDALPKDRSIAVLVQRGGSPIFLPLKLEGVSKNRITIDETH